MATLPALPALNTSPPPDPLASLQRILAIKSLLGQQEGQQQERQIRGVQLQEAQLTLQDKQAMTKAMAAWDGKDYGELPNLVKQNGGSFDAVLQTTKGIQDIRQKAATFDETTLKNEQTRNDQYRGRLQSIIDADPSQQDSLWAAEIAKERAAGTQIPPGIPTGKYPGDDTATYIANHFALGSTLAKEAIDAKQANARQTSANAAAGELDLKTKEWQAKTDPNSPQYDPSAAFLAKKAAAGDPEAQIILAQQTKQAGAKAGAEAAAKFPWEQKLEQMRQGGSPVYAFDPKQNATVLTTKEQAQQGGMQAIRKVGEADIAKDTQTARQLGDAQLNVSAYRMASQKMDELTGTDIRNVARLTGSQEFKAQFLGAELPMDWANQLAKNDSWQSLPQDAKEAVASYIGARGAIIAYAKAISGTGRLTESQLKTETANLPDPTTPSDVREMQFNRFQRNIDQVASGLPKLPGVDSPAAIRARVEGQAAAEQGARANNAARQAAATGQYKNAQGNRMQVGQEAYDTSKRYLGTVSKVYADGSYDVKPD